MLVVYLSTVFSGHLNQNDVHIWYVIFVLGTLVALLFIFMANGYYLLIAMYRG